MNFADAGYQLSYKVAVLLRAFYDKDVPLSKTGRVSMELSNELRALAIMALLSLGDNRLFYQNLVRSGLVREFYLNRLKEAGVSNDHHQASSRFKPLLDTVAAGDLDVARRIAVLSPKEFRHGHEYMDDYCYSQILHGLISENSSKSSLKTYLNRFENYLENQTNARFEISRALIEADQAAFNDAFIELLNTHEQDINSAKKRGQMEDPLIMAHRLVFIEGLAILRIAQMVELTVESEYRFCPSISRSYDKKPSS